MIELDRPAAEQVERDQYRRLVSRDKKIKCARRRRDAVRERSATRARHLRRELRIGSARVRSRRLTARDQKQSQRETNREASSQCEGRHKLFLRMNAETQKVTDESEFKSFYFANQRTLTVNYEL
jgi:hypothetical protein